LLKLGKGELDAAFIVAAAEAPILSEFYKIPGIQLMSFDQADAYTRHLPYLSKVSVPRGLLSIKHDVPHQDIWVLAPKAELVTHDHTSPATITLLLSASHDILKSYSHLNKPGEFPSSTGMDFPVDADAEIYLKDGPSFLYRYLPFWTAVWIGRFIKIVIPLMVLFIPLFKYIPSVKSFLLRLKFARIYAELRTLEQNGAHPEHRAESLERLEDIAKRVNHLKVPMMDTRDLFELKRHLGEVRNRLSE
jgi:hypothetical protein